MRDLGEEFRFSDITLRFPTEARRVGMELFPTALAGKLAERRITLRGLDFIDAMPGDHPWPASAVGSLAHVKILGDPYTGGFAQGHTMHDAPSLDRFHFADRRTERADNRTEIVTTLVSESGHRIEHRIAWHEGDEAAEVVTTFTNGSDAPVTLELLTSFSLGGVTPFHSADAPGRLRVHRFRSVWSAEGRLETRTLEKLHLERSWAGGIAFNERFGQVGTMPVRKWFPFVAIEDVEAGVVWGAQLAWAGSWQMEIFRRHDEVSISGGLADREFGHWMKTLAPGESLIAPAATISCVHGSLDDLCDRLTATQQRAADAHPAIEHDLPVVFNEWCTTWGDPQHDKVVVMADRLRDSEVRYLVIDAGWYKAGDSDWSSGHGDWVPSQKLFPHGIEAAAAAIRERGLIPGLWFEMETVGSQSAAFSIVDHLLRRDGFPVTTRDRRFWDLNDPWAVDYLTTHVIDLLERAGFGYLKVDYNETLGLGSDDPDGIGEGLRKQVLGSYRFFEKIRQRLPHLVIENCASGGHRLEPSMLARTAMSSFSDAHELVEIPIIAANLHRLLLPRQSQIWAVLHRSDSDRRLAYSLAATFLGRMCLSGGIIELDDTQWQLALEAQRLYRKAAPVIKHGTSRRVGQMGESWRYPRGWQAVVRTGADSHGALIVIHAFADAPKRLGIPLPSGDWQLAGQFPTNTAAIDGSMLRWPVAGDFSAGVVLLSRGNDPVPS